MTLASVDPFLGRRYHETRYNCMHFTAEVWLAATGRDVAALLQGLIDAGLADRRIRARHRRAFERLAAPTDPCIVLMQRPRTAPHFGVYVRGRVLHIRERGVEYQPAHIAALGFERIGYYLPHEEDPRPS